MVRHTILPVYNIDSKILILGSFPSIKSRETKFFYGHPQNRFWKVLSNIYNSDIPAAIKEKETFLLKQGIAVWDVISSCEINGSADSSIKNVEANDLLVVLNSCEIKQIFVNGKTAEKLYNKHIRPLIKRDVVYLPSTSPANAKYSLEDLIKEWSIIKNY